jgi:YHS domain-containing protein
MNQDPVCGVPVDEATALYDEFDGKTFYFCSYLCRHQFLATSSETNLAEKCESPRA